MCYNYNAYSLCSEFLKQFYNFCPALINMNIRGFEYFLSPHKLVKKSNSQFICINTCTSVCVEGNVNLCFRMRRRKRYICNIFKQFKTNLTSNFGAFLQVICVAKGYGRGNDSYAVSGISSAVNGIKNISNSIKTSTTYTIGNTLETFPKY